METGRTHRKPHILEYGCEQLYFLVRGGKVNPISKFTHGNRMKSYFTCAIVVSHASPFTIGATLDYVSGRFHAGVGHQGQLGLWVVPCYDRYTFRVEHLSSAIGIAHSLLHKLGQVTLLLHYFSPLRIELQQN